MIEVHHPAPWVRCALDAGGAGIAFAAVRDRPGFGLVFDEHAQVLAQLLEAWASLPGVEGGEVTARLVAAPVPGLDVTVTAAHPVAWPLPAALPATRVDRWSSAAASGAWVRLGGHSPEAERRLGVAQHTFRDAPFCGDGWAVAANAGTVAAMIVDGLGHGPVAAIAAGEAVDAFLADSLTSPEASIARLHAQLGPTCGGVGAVARYDVASQTVTYAGVGDTSGRLVSADRSKGMATSAGILGRRLPGVRAFHYTATDAVLVLHTDGISHRWGPADLPGLFERHPALVAAVLHRVQAYESDDATVLVVALHA